MDDSRLNKGKVALESLAAKEFTPSQPITDPKLFSGRQEIIEYLRGFSGVVGRNFVIYGERGVGKTSFCNVLFWGSKVYTHNCSKRDDFVTIFLNILSRLGAQFTTDERKFLGKSGYSIGTDGVWGHSASIEAELSSRPVAEQKLNLGFLINKFRKLEKKIDVIVLDEFQTIESPDIQTDIIEAVKAIADNAISIQIAIVGVASSDEELLTSTEYPQYKLRHFVAVEVPRMSKEEIKDIIQRRKDVFKFNNEEIDGIADLSCGYPFSAHNIALLSIRSWIDRNANKIAGSLLFLGIIIPGSGIIAPLLMLSSESLLKAAARRIDIYIINLDLAEAASRSITEFNRNYKSEAFQLTNLLVSANNELILKILILLSQSTNDNFYLPHMSEELSIDKLELELLINQQLKFLVNNIGEYRYNLANWQVGPYISCWNYLKEMHHGKYTTLLQNLTTARNTRSTRRT